MLIVLASSNAYAMPLAVALRSIVESNRKHWPLEFYIFYDGHHPGPWQKVFDSLPPGSARIQWLPMELRLFAGFSMGETRYMSKMSYARLAIPWLLPVDVSRVLYLDVDLLVLEELDTLWQTDLQGAVAGAVPDLFLHTDYVKEGLDPEAGRVNHFCYKGLPRVPKYFNSGVLLIDLDRWREERISEKAFDYLKAYPHTPHMDQDGLNVACNGFYKELDPRWNNQDHYQRVTGESRRGILHFVTAAKPWLANARSHNAGLYDSFRSRTLFRRTPLDKGRDSLLRLMAGMHNVMKRGGFRKGSARDRNLFAALKT